ncbi:MAG: alkaline phosphatase family protein [Anaerolineales bacterium]|jgi:phospholipase C
MNRKFYVIISGLLLLMACTGRSMQSTRTVRSSGASSITDLQVNKSARPLFGHVIVVVMENLDITKAEQLPYLKELMNKYAYTRNYTGIAHPSLPNHVGLISGDTYGLSSDCDPGPDCHVPGTSNNLADELEAAGLTWKAYLEGMPKACTSKDWLLYAVRHNPFVYFDSIRNDRERCIAHDVPFREFRSDLDAGELPNFAWVTPNLCHGMHTKCWFRGSREQQGAKWLESFVPKVLAGSQFQNDGLLIITFDEGEGIAGCCDAAGGGKVLTLLISNTSAVKSSGWASDTAYNHYSLLRTLEENWGLPYLGRSGDPDVVSMSEFFNQTK